MVNTFYMEEAMQKLLLDSELYMVLSELTVIPLDMMFYQWKGMMKCAKIERI